MRCVAMLQTYRWTFRLGLDVNDVKRRFRQRSISRNLAQLYSLYVVDVYDIVSLFESSFMKGSRYRLACSVVSGASRGAFVLTL